MNETYYHRTTYQCSVCQGRGPNDWCSTCGGTGIVQVTEIGIDHIRLVKTALVAVIFVAALFLCPYVARLIWGVIP